MIRFPASDEAVHSVLSRTPQGHGRNGRDPDIVGRSAWFWIRTEGGIRILACYPWTREDQLCCDADLATARAENGAASVWTMQP